MVGVVLEFNGQLFFGADDGENGKLGQWYNRRYSITGINPGGSSSNPSGFMALFFGADDGQNFGSRMVQPKVLNYC